MTTTADCSRIWDSKTGKYVPPCERREQPDRRTTDLIVEIDRRIEQARRSNDEAYCSVQAELRNDAALDQPWKLPEAA